MEEEENAFDMPETTKEEIIDKITMLAWQIRNDWSDPRSECRKIVSLCEKLRLNNKDNETLIGKTLDLDLGSTPVNVTIKEITDTKVIVDYNHSTPGRTEEFSISDFEYFSRLKISKSPTT